MDHLDTLTKAIPAGADQFKVAKFFARNGERVTAIVESEFGHLVPHPIRQDRNAWWGATTDVDAIEKLEPLFRRKGTVAGIAVGTPRQPYFKRWDGSSMQKFGELAPEQPKPPVTFKEFLPSYSADKVHDAFKHALKTSQIVQKAEDERKACLQKAADLQPEIQAYDQLNADIDRVESRINTAEAEAIISGEARDLKDDLEQSSVLRRELRRTKRSAEASRTAVKMLHREAAKLDNLLPTLRENMHKARQAWLESKRAFVCDQLRKHLHDMSPIMADLLAIEHIGSFRVDYGREIIRTIGSPDIENFGVKPEWADIWTDARFPGYEQAVAALQSELNGGA